MNPQELFGRLQAAAAALSPRQLATLAFAFVAVVGVTIASAYWLNQPSYDVLFSDLDPESAGAVVTRLKTAKVQYVLEDGGRTVKVPAARINELRLDIASQGMPGTGRVGFEIFDRTSFGVTDFMEHVNYRRALEGELARTIASLGEVSGARVHIAMPQPSLFVGQDRPTTASVVLKLRQNRQLPQSTVNAITSLVAGSVESLRPESVVVIDNYGRPLARTAASEELNGNGGQQLERQQQIEQQMSTRLVSLLEPIVGVDRVHINVTAKLVGDTQEETEERWDPTTVVRSRQVTSQSSTSASATPAVAGARANLPAAPATGTAIAAVPPPVLGGTSGMAETTNYEVSKLTRHRIQPQGGIARLSVAIVIDDDRPVPQAGQNAPAKSTPRTPAEIQKIHDLAAAAVGFDQMRGDQLTVENIAFEEAPVEEIVPVPVWQRYQPQAFEAVRIVGIVLLAIVALFGVIRPMIRGSLGAGATGLVGAGSAVALQPKTVRDLEKEIDAELGAAGAPRRLPVLARRAATLTEQEPENTARLLRAWLSEEER